MRKPLTTFTILLIVLAPAAVAAQGRGVGQPPGGRGQRPPRDAARAPEPSGTATITGRVFAADSRRPLKRARVIVGGAGRPRIATTDETGRYLISALPAGTYTVSASKTGFVDGAFGQRRALREGTPIRLADGQQLANVDLILARGAVVTGRVLDEDGEPLARTRVQGLRYQYLRGERRLVGAGADLTDDRGQYRIFGLPPGEYVVSATATELEGFTRRFNINPPPVSAGFDDSPESTGYAPTYYPGVMAAADASRLKVAAAQELTGIDFQLQLVPLATVRGISTDPRGGVSLISEDGAGPMRMQLQASVQDDGSFSIRNVPPGKYIAVARTDGVIGSASIAMQPVVVNGEDVMITLTPVKASHLGGTLTFESTATPPPKTFGGFRISAQPLGAMLLLPRANRPAQIDGTGRFTLADLLPGQYVIQVNTPRGWTVRNVYLDGRDVTDQPVEVKGGENSEGFRIVFSDRVSGLSGAVHDANAAPVAGVTVIAFPTDAGMWRPTRRIQAVRTDQNGAYSFNNLPPDEYFVVTTGDVEQGEWFDPSYLESVREKGVRVTIGEGELKVQNLKAS